jgi:hypothetical protein
LHISSLYRPLMILLWWSIYCPLFGQSGGVSSAVKVDSIRVISIDTLSIDTVWPNIQRVALAPRGDIRLRRFKSKKIVFDTVPANYAFQLHLNHQLGQPFQGIQLVLADTILKDAGIASFQYADTFTQLCRPVLIIKPHLSIKRQMAQITAYRYIPARPTVRYRTREVLVRSLPNNKKDTLYSIGVEEFGKKKVLEDRLRVTKKGKNQILHQQKDRIITAKKYPPILSQPTGIRYLPRLKPLSLRYSTFYPRDTLIFTVTSVDKKPLKQVVLVDDQSVERHRMSNTSVFSDTLVVVKERYFDMKISANPSLKKQAVKLDVRCIRPTKYDTAYIQFDTLFGFETRLTYDTLAFLIKDDSMLLAATRNIESNPNVQWDLLVPPLLADKDTLHLLYVAYWFGITRPCLDQYQFLEASVPKTWSLPGVPPALCAVALQYPLILPRITISDVGVQMNIVGAKGKKHRLEASLARNLGVITADALKALVYPEPMPSPNILPMYHFVIDFNNRNTVNAYPIQFKMIAFYSKVTSKKRVMNTIKTDKKKYK